MIGLWILFCFLIGIDLGGGTLSQTKSLLNHQQPSSLKNNIAKMDKMESGVEVGVGMREEEISLLDDLNTSTLKISIEPSPLGKGLNWMEFGLDGKGRKAIWISFIIFVNLAIFIVLSCCIRILINCYKRLGALRSIPSVRPEDRVSYSSTLNRVGEPSVELTLHQPSAPIFTMMPMPGHFVLQHCSYAPSQTTQGPSSPQGPSPSLPAYSLTQIRPETPPPPYPGLQKAN